MNVIENNRMLSSDACGLRVVFAVVLVGFEVIL